jgi:predicted DNA-binding antitoxin AbrB/MazE fold protein
MDIPEDAFVGRLVSVKVSGGALHPLEPLDLPEGAEITIKIFPPEKPLEERLATIRASAGAWKGFVDCEKLERNIYADRLIQTRKEAKL